MPRVLPRVLVIAKAPVPGRSKTRLCPPCTDEQAASLAEAALADTLAAVSQASSGGRTLVLEGSPGEWLPEGFEVVAQRGDGLAERLAAAFADADGAALLVGMDTPQLRPEMIDDALCRLQQPGCDAVLGPAEDGGYWAIGMRVPRPSAFLGVPMSTSAPRSDSGSGCAASACASKSWRRCATSTTGPTPRPSPRPPPGVDLPGRSEAWSRRLPELGLTSAMQLYEIGLGSGSSGDAPVRFDAVGEDGSRRRLPLERWLRRAAAGEEQVLRRALRPGPRRRLRRRPAPGRPGGARHRGDRGGALLLRRGDRPRAGGEGDRGVDLRRPEERDVGNRPPARRKHRDRRRTEASARQGRGAGAPRGSRPGRGGAAADPNADCCACGWRAPAR